MDLVPYRYRLTSRFEAIARQEADGFPILPLDLQRAKHDFLKNMKEFPIDFVSEVLLIDMYASLAPDFSIDPNYSIRLSPPTTLSYFRPMNHLDIRRGYNISAGFTLPGKDRLNYVQMNRIFETNDKKWHPENICAKIETKDSNLQGGKFLSTLEPCPSLCVEAILNLSRLHTRPSVLVYGQYDQFQISSNRDIQQLGLPLYKSQTLITKLLDFSWILMKFDFRDKWFQGARLTCAKISHTIFSLARTLQLKFLQGLDGDVQSNNSPSVSVRFDMELLVTQRIAFFQQELIRTQVEMNIERDVDEKRVLNFHIQHLGNWIAEEITQLRLNHLPLIVRFEAKVREFHEKLFTFRRADVVSYIFHQ